ncbi:kynurenine formamidase isoform 11 [Homo sapiens]|uniref:kynurenine formamidase isoform 11 n=1 Tax=Homo sapiens TaxID=9606 RepID=UPI00192776C8|nr:kynurenine formamidase isoform 11 [Homo sapiens]
MMDVSGVGFPSKVPWKKMSAEPPQGPGPPGRACCMSPMETAKGRKWTFTSPTSRLKPCLSSCSFTEDTGRAEGFFLVSGVFDLEPIVYTSQNVALQLTLPCVKESGKPHLKSSTMWTTLKLLRI